MLRLAVVRPCNGVLAGRFPKRVMDKPSELQRLFDVLPPQGHRRRALVMLKSLVALAGASVLVAACAEDPHTTNTTLGGAALGAVAGAVIGNNVGSGNAATGAAIGAAVGGAAGAV